MSFYIFEDMRGSILFENNNFLLCKAEPRRITDINITTLQNLHPVNVDSAVPGVRFPDVLFLTKNIPFTEIGNEEIELLEQESFDNSDPELQSIIFTVKALKGRQEKINIQPFFTTGVLNGETIDFSCFTRAELGKYSFNKKEKIFNLEYNSFSNDKLTGLYFVNEFETISVPIQPENNEEINQILEKVKNRVSLEGRISSAYMIFAVKNHSSPSACVLTHVRGLRNMKTDEMLTFFCHHKKCGTKIETLSECLRSISKRYCKNLDQEAGQVSLLHVSTYGQGTLRMNIPPIDWILCRAAFLKILHTDVTSSGVQNIFVKIVNEPVDDFAQILYTMWEQSNNTIHLALFQQEQIKQVFKACRQIVNKKELA